MLVLELKAMEPPSANVLLVIVLIDVCHPEHAMCAGSSPGHTKGVLVHLQLQSVMLILQLVSLMIQQWKKKQYAKDAQNQVRL